MKYLFSVICCLFSVCCFSQFYIGYTEKECRDLIRENQGSYVSIYKGQTESGTFLRWQTYVNTSMGLSSYTCMISFNNVGLSYTFWLVGMNSTVFNETIKVFNKSYTSISDLEWLVYVKNRKFDVLGRYVEAANSYAIYYTEISN